MQEILYIYIYIYISTSKSARPEYHTAYKDEHRPILNLIESTGGVVDTLSKMYSVAVAVIDS